MAVITTEQANSKKSALLNNFLVVFLRVDKGNQAFQSPFSGETRFSSYEDLGLGIKGKF